MAKLYIKGDHRIIYRLIVCALYVRVYVCIVFRDNMFLKSLYDSLKLCHDKGQIATYVIMELFMLTLL